MFLALTHLEREANILKKTQIVMLITNHRHPPIYKMLDSELETCKSLPLHTRSRTKTNNHIATITRVIVVFEKKRLNKSGHHHDLHQTPPTPPHVLYIHMNNPVTPTNTTNTRFLQTDIFHVASLPLRGNEGESTVGINPRR